MAQSKIEVLEEDRELPEESSSSASWR
jgi:hypothetical protein